MKELNRRPKLYLFCVEKKTSLARSTKLSHAFNCLFYSLCSLADKAIFFWWNNVKVLIDNNYKLMTTPVQVAVHYIYHLHSRVSNCPVPLSIFYVSRNIIFYIFLSWRYLFISHNIIFAFTLLFSHSILVYLSLFLSSEVYFALLFSRSVMVYYYILLVLMASSYHPLILFVLVSPRSVCSLFCCFGLSFA